MTTEEIQQFKQKIMETIIPLAINMTEEQIKNIIDSVERENPNLPNGFGAMLLEQIIVHKYNRLR